MNEDSHLSNFQSYSMEENMFKMMQVRDSHHQVAHNNISKAQAKQK